MPKNISALRFFRLTPFHMRTLNANRVSNNQNIFPEGKASRAVQLGEKPISAFRTYFNIITKTRWCYTNIITTPFYVLYIQKARQTIQHLLYNAWRINIQSKMSLYTWKWDCFNDKCMWRYFLLCSPTSNGCPINPEYLISCYHNTIIAFISKYPRHHRYFRY